MRLLTFAFATMVCAVAPVAPAAAAQGDGAEVGLSSCVLRGPMPLAKGRRLFVNCDSVYVYNQVGKRALTALAESLTTANARVKRTNDSLVTTLKGLVSVTESISASKSAIIAHMDSIRRIDSTAYASLSRMTSTMDSLARRSVANTDKALSYINRVQFASYVASALGGGVIGGFASKGSGEAGFDLGGAGIGAGIGVVVNFLVMRVFAR